MATEDLRRLWESQDEYLKDAVEFAMHSLAKNQLGMRVIDLIRGGERVYDDRLSTEIAGVAFENPVMLGGGWDKRGWVVDASYALGFSVDEVGSVPLRPQPGNDLPRLFYDRQHHTARNAFGFNSIGADSVASYLDKQQRLGKVGISLTKNKDTKEEEAPDKIAEVAKVLYEYADYFVINFSSPNTPGLRDMMLRQLRDTIRAVNKIQEDIPVELRKPVFIKTTLDMSAQDMLEVMSITVEEGAAGVIDTNTTVDDDRKAQYGWSGKPGGLSGNDPVYRQRADERMMFITKESEGTGLARIGVGAINSAETAIRRMKFGAQAVQVVTAMRESKLKIAQQINEGLLAEVERENLRNISEIVGIYSK